MFWKLVVFLRCLVSARLFCFFNLLIAVGILLIAMKMSRSSMFHSEVVMTTGVNCHAQGAAEIVECVCKYVSGISQNLQFEPLLTRSSHGVFLLTEFD